MRSAVRTESPIFTRARFRLTAWYVTVLAAVLIMLGAAVYLLVRQQTFSNIDSGINLTAARAENAYLTRNLAELTRLNRSPYFVTVLDNFAVLRTKAAAARDLPNYASMRAALDHGEDRRTIGSGSSRLRVYSVRMEQSGTTAGVLQVARSTQPEHDTLGNLLGGLLIGGGAGLVLTAIGGWFLAGRSLAPVRDAFEHQKEFVADASHELRTPLAVIRANAEFLAMEQPDNVELREVLRESDRLASLVDSLLSLARGDVRAGAAELHPLDAGIEVETAVGSLQHLARDREVELSVSTAPGLIVKGSAEQLRQLVVLLVDNALRYTPGGGQVHVQAAADGGNALITVHDTGIGIPEQAIGHVFERFYRADEARNRESGGSGLGLAIARELVKQHAGRIEVESTEGLGTTIAVRIPLVRSAIREPQTQS
jgi:two-component system, OmpR family, sensor histidine kinase CiaH